jgi:hypothetical protein
VVAVPPVTFPIAASGKCGLWEIGFQSDTKGTSLANVSLGASPSAFWSAGTTFVTGVVGWQENVSGTNDMQLVACTSISAVDGCTAAAHTPAGAYDADTAGNSITPFATAPFIPTSTVLSFTLNGATAGTDSITLLLRAVGINSSTGGETLSSKPSQAVTISNITLQSTPEPSSIFLLLSGIAATGAGKFRRRR